MDELGQVLLAELEGGWFPYEGPQARAFACEADVLFYGGAAGGGKSDLLLGLAHTRHRSSVIFRREYSQLPGLEARARELLSARGEVSGRTWRLRDGRTIEFGAVQLPGDEIKWQGRPHDLIGLDELTHFTEAQFRFLAGWLRSVDETQRKRVVATGNPPTDQEGAWVIRYFAPWLDEAHPDPAEPGELRWFAMVDGVDVERPDGRPFVHGPETIQPLSRTFIPAKLEDNPQLDRSGYRAQLQNLPEPLRSQLLYGDFAITQEDDPWQVIPSAWVKAAQARWTPEPPGPMDALGVDVARGGKDKTVLSPRHGHWFGPQSTHPGRETPDGQEVIRLIVEALRDARGGRPQVNVDIINVGNSVVDLGRQQGITVNALNGAAGTKARDLTNSLGFFNCRAWWWWSLREALDPDSGQDLALPPDRILFGDLTAPRWRLTARGVLLEDKAITKVRIGRSPDKGDSIVYAHAQLVVKGAAYLELARRDLAARPAETAEEERACYAVGSLEWQQQQGRAA